MKPYVFILTDAITGDQRKVYFDTAEEVNQCSLHYSYPGPAFVALAVEVATGKVLVATYGTVNNRQHIESVKERMKDIA